MSDFVRSRVIYHHVHSTNFGSVTDLACAYVRDLKADDLAFRVSITLAQDWIQKWCLKNNRRVPALFEFSVSNEAWIARFKVPLGEHMISAEEVEREFRLRSFGETSYVRNSVAHVDADAKTLEVLLGSSELTDSFRNTFTQDAERIELGDLDYQKLLETQFQYGSASAENEPVYRLKNAAEVSSQELQIVRGGRLSGFTSAVKNLFSTKKDPEVKLGGSVNEVREKDLIIHELREKIRETSRQVNHLRIKLRDQNVKEQNWVFKLSQAESNILAEKSEKNRLFAVIRDLREHLAKASRSIEQHRPNEWAELRTRLDHSIREENRLRNEVARYALVEEQKQTLLKRIDELKLQLVHRSQVRETIPGQTPNREQIEFYQKQVGELKRMNQNLLERVAELENAVKHRETESNQNDSEKVRLKLEEALKRVVKHRQEAEQLRLRIDEMARENEVLKAELQRAAKGENAA